MILLIWGIVEEEEDEEGVGPKRESDLEGMVETEVEEVVLGLVLSVTTSVGRGWGWMMEGRGNVEVVDEFPPFSPFDPFEGMGTSKVGFNPSSATAFRRDSPESSTECKNRNNSFPNRTSFASIANRINRTVSCTSATDK